ASLTLLDRYATATDTNYAFTELTSTPVPGGTLHILEMTSQAWLTTNEVDRPVWKHWMSVACPDDITNQTALLFIAGGSRKQGSPATPPEALNRTMGNFVKLAMETKSVVVELHDVPNQPLVFAGDGRPRLEDGLIAFTWD